MKRIPEPELMEDKEQVVAYSNANFSDSNNLFVEEIIFLCSKSVKEIIDLGCGPGEIPIMLSKRKPDLKITAIDGSKEMIKIATNLISKEKLENRIKLVKSYLPNFDFGGRKYDLIISKDFLHHLHNPKVLWDLVKELGKKGAYVYVMDLFRPKSSEKAKEIVEIISSKEHPLLKKDFYNSLCAAFTINEVKDQLKNSGLNLEVLKISKRHMVIRGKL